MRRHLCSTCLVSWLVLGHGAGAGAQDVASPGPGGLAASSSPREGSATTAPAEIMPPHEALPPSGALPRSWRIAKAPPAMIAERPGAQRPGPDARWIEGYWDWDESREDFAWVTGTWLVPPPGEFWVAGYWRRDAKGWYRVPGCWSGGGQVQKVMRVQEVALSGRTTGPSPSLTRPEETIGNAPGPDYFYVPGEYVPAWGGVAWRSGFWAPSHPGWEWIPARWERRADTWVFHEGFWYRLPGSTIPRPGGSPPAGGTALASAPAGNGSSPVRSVSSPGSPANPVTASGGTDARTPQTSQSGQGAGRTTKDTSPPKPGETKPGPQPENSQQPPYVWYGPQPVYSPGRAALGNAGAAFGGFLRRVLP